MSWGESKWIVDQIVSKVGQPPNNMRTFVAHSLSESSIGLQFLEPQDSVDSEGNILCAVAGVMIRMSETDYPSNPSEGTLVIDNKDLGAYATNPYVITGLTENKECYFSAFPYSVQDVYNTSPNAVNRASQIPVAFKIYGVSRSVSSSSPSWARTDNGVGKTATASVGTTPGASDFDTCYPWSDMVRETLSTGDVMVKIPVFYYERKVVDGVEIIRISDKPTQGFVQHPGSGKYLGAYKTSGNNKSVSKASPTVNQTRATMRTNAKAKGDGWSLIDKSVESALQMLFLVEFATYDAQSAVGRGYCDKTSSGAAITVGSCDNVPNLTGRPSGTDGLTDVVYRGVEGFWGNIWEWVDGINFNNGAYYVCTDPTKYADDTTANYTQLGYTGATNWSSSYITAEGMDNNVPWAMLPSAAGSGSASTYMTDACWSSTGWRVCLRGGGWAIGSFDGLLTVSLSNASSGAGAGIGSRLLYSPS